VADPAKRMWAFYRFHIPDPICFEKRLKVTIQSIGGTDRDKVREFLRCGHVLIPVSVDSKGKFIKLLEAGAPRIDAPNFPDGWVNFYREDDYCATAYFYLDKPAHELPLLPPIDVRLKDIK
jgi:hypothetical protein